MDHCCRGRWPRFAHICHRFRHNHGNNNDTSLFIFSRQAQPLQDVRQLMNRLYFTLLRGWVRLGLVVD